MKLLEEKIQKITKLYACDYTEDKPFIGIFDCKERSRDYYSYKYYFWDQSNGQYVFIEDMGDLQIKMKAFSSNTLLSIYLKDKNQLLSLDKKTTLNFLVKKLE